MNTYIFIDGGESFTTHEQYLNWISTTAVEWNLAPVTITDKKKKWKSELASKLIAQGDRVYIPDFPNPQNAKYTEWKLFFEAWIDRIEIVGSLTLIGHSLGGNFLVKYFGEIEKYDGNPETATQEKINLLFLQNIHLVAACISEGDFTTPENYDILRSLRSKVHIWHAEDDTMVPYATAKILTTELPQAQTHFFDTSKGYGHFFPLAVFREFEDAVLQK